MTIHVSIWREGDYAYWAYGFRLLAITRNQPLYGIAGVPDAIADSPDALTEITKRYMARHKKVRGDARTRYEEAVRRHVEATFGAVADAYGEPDAGALLAWMWRNFIDHEQKTGLSAWWSVLFPLAAGRVPVPSTLSEHSAGVLSAALSRWLGSAARMDERNAVAAGLAIPLRLEEQALTVSHSGADADSPRVVDLVGLLRVVVTQEGARRVWVDLTAALTPDEYQPLLTWAGVEGRTRRLPPVSLDALTRPPASAGPGGGLPP